MRGSVIYQVQQLFQEVNDIGTSKHHAKEEARDNGAKTWAEIGKELGIHSYGTADAYRDVWRSIGYIAREDGVKSMEDVTNAHVTKYLQGVIDRDLAYSTFTAYAAAVEKLETALNRYAATHATDREYSFDLQAVRESAADQLERFEGSRAYDRPGEVVKAVEDPRLSLAARVMYEGGPRVREAAQIDQQQLTGIRCDKYTNEERGYIDVVGKGGQRYCVGVRPETYRALELAIKEGGGRFKIDPEQLRAALKEASDVTTQSYNGSHGLRWNHAQERMEELQTGGLQYEMALSVVSREMGHRRPDITERYLG